MSAGGGWRASWAIARADLRRATRDRLGMVFVLVVPFVLIAAFGASSGGQGAAVRLGVVVGPGPTGAAIVHDLRANGVSDVQGFTSVGSLRRAVQTRHVTAGVVLPASDRAVGSAGPPPVRLIGASGDPRTAIAELDVAAAIARVTGRAQAVAWLSDNRSLSAAEAAAAVDRATTTRSAPRFSVLGGSRSSSPEGFARTAPANLVLFLFLNSVASAGLLIETRRRGVLARMRTAPIGARVLVQGQLIGRLAICLLQAAIIMVGSSVLFGVRWGSVPWLVAVVVLFSVISAGASVLVSVVLRTREQVLFIAPPIAIALGMLGGCMWPLSIVSRPLRMVGHATPHAWAVDALDRLGAGGSPGSEVARELAVLAAFAVAAVAASVVILYRQAGTSPRRDRAPSPQRAEDHAQRRTARVPAGR